eukprot:1794186-Rhodomonas_salina.1
MQHNAGARGADLECVETGEHVRAEGAEEGLDCEEACAEGCGLLRPREPRAQALDWVFRAPVRQAERRGAEEAYGCGED